MKKKEKRSMITVPERIGFLTFSTASNIVYNFRSLYYLIFLTNVLKVNVLTAGTILTLGLVWDAINDPIIGLITANHTFKNGEKVRPMALWFALPWAAATVLLFSNFHTGKTLTVILCLVLYLLFDALDTCIAMPYNSMGSLASNIDEDRKSINAFRSLGGCLGSGIGAVAVTPIVMLFGGLKGEGAIIGVQDARPLFLTALVMGAICLIGCLTHYFTTKERVHQIAEVKEEKLTLIQAYKMLFKCRSWIMNMLYIICYGIINCLIMTNINYYAAYILGSSSAATPILAVYLAVAVVLSVLTPKIDELLGRKKTMALGAIIQILGKIPFIIDPYSAVSIYINALSVGIGSTICFVMFNTNRNNISDIVEYKNNRRIDSMVAAGDNLVSKLADAAATELIALSLALAGFDESLLINQTQATRDTICTMLGWIPAIISILMLFVIWKLDTQKEMRESKAAYEEKFGSIKKADDGV